MTLLDSIRPDIDKHDIVSFDIFDTALFRIGERHRTTAFLVQCKLHEHAIAWQYPKFVSNFLWVRHEAEAAARRERAKEEGDHEVTFDEIYDVVTEVAGVPLSIARQAQQIELEIETWQLRVNPEMHDVWQYARDQQKHIIFVSDMYHTQSTLTTWLENVGYKNAKVYVSSEYRQSKQEGSLFRAVSAQVPSSSIIHIGDNYKSDVESAQFNSWTAVHYQYQFPYATYTQNPSPEYGLLTGPLQGQTFDSEYEALGASTFGPLVAGFLLWIYYNTTSDSPLLFLSRDGYLLHTLASRYFTNRTLYYVDASRIAALSASLYSFDMPKVARYVLGKAGRAIGDLLRVYGLEQPEMYMHEITRAGFRSLSSMATEEHSEQITKLLLYLQQPLQQAALSTLQHAEKYFEPFLGKQITMIDLGWSGSVQKYLSQVLNARSTTYINGLYYQLWNFPNFHRTSLHDTYRAYLRDVHAPHTLSRALMSHGGVEILENVLSEPHGTVLRYDTDGPIREEFVHPQIDAIEQIHAGIEKYVESLFSLIRLSNASTLIMYPWNEPFERLVHFPTATEAELVGVLEHGDGIGDLESQATPLAPILSSYKEELENVYWTRGFILRNQVREE